MLVGLSFGLSALRSPHVICAHCSSRSVRSIPTLLSVRDVGSVGLVACYIPAREHRRSAHRAARQPAAHVIRAIVRRRADRPAVDRLVSYSTSSFDNPANFTLATDSW